MNNLTNFNYFYICMNKFNFFLYLYKYYFANFSKMVIDTKLIFSAYTQLLTGFLTTYHLYL